MVRKDWVFGADRNAQARERILSAASDLVSRNGFEAFTIDALAATLHCSAATIYRHAGGKNAILEALIFRFADRIRRAVNDALVDLEGTERVTAAILVGLEHIRAEPLGKLIMGDIRPDQDSGAISASPLVAKFAEEMIGHSDPVAAQWLFRITFSLWYWPIRDKQMEAEMVRRFAAPSVTRGLLDAPPDGGRATIG